MKKRRWKAVAAVLLLVAAVGTAAFFALRSSPAYALLLVAGDVKEAGVEGLKPHLTGDALELVEKLDGAKDNKVMDAISSILDADWVTERLQDQLTQIQWELDDMQRHKGRAEITLEFNYRDRLTGDVEIDMIRENGCWKISGIRLSDLERP